MATGAEMTGSDDKVRKDPWFYRSNALLCEQTPLSGESGGTGMSWFKRVNTTEAKAPQLVWGRPSSCPRCGGAGYLDHVDLVDRFMEQRCPDCEHRWTTTEAEINAQASA